MTHTLPVLYLTLNPNRTSTLRSVEGWFGVLRQRGLRPVMAFDRLGTFHEWAVTEGIPSFHVPLRRPSKVNPLPFFRSLWRLRCLVRRYDIQVIHCNEHDVYPIGQYLGRMCRLPVVVGVHCQMARGYTKWAFQGRRAPHHVFHVSENNAQLCRPAMDGLLPESRQSVLHNALDLKKYAPDAALRDAFRRQRKLTDEILVGTACIISPVKQLEHFFRVAAGIDSPQVKFILAGGALRGYEQYAARILNEANNRLGDRLRHVGRLNDLVGFFNAVDVFINTSAHEAFGLSVLEAMACGCPILGYPSRAVAEVILPKGGEVVEQDSVCELTATLNQWLQQPGRLVEKRWQARQQAEQFDVRPISDRLWRTYYRVLRDFHNQAPCDLHDQTPMKVAADSRQPDGQLVREGTE